MPNLVTTSGKGVITGRMIGATPSQAEPKYIAWGTGTSATVAADTAIQTESAEARVAGTGSVVTTTTTNDTHQIVGTMTATATRAIGNAGVLDAATGGNLYIKSDFGVINLFSGDSIAFTFKVQFT